jgi:two-component sensor histidine kinase
VSKTRATCPRVNRVKNSLATVQSIINQTLRGAADIESARATLNARIIALAGAHDRLTVRSWAGADPWSLMLLRHS